MSQKKVDRYKEQKRNRDSLKKKEEREWMLTKIGMSIVGLILVVWIGVSAYDLITTPSTDTTNRETYTVRMSALTDYLGGLSTTEETAEEETEASTEASTEAGTEAATEADTEAATEAATEAGTEAGTEAATEA